MKTKILITPASALLLAFVPLAKGGIVSLTPADMNAGNSATTQYSDANVTLTPLQSGTPATFNANATLLGIDDFATNVNAFNDPDTNPNNGNEEQLQIEFEANAGLTELNWRFARADGPGTLSGVRISGFTTDPGAVLTGSANGTASVVYSAGTLQVKLPYSGAVGGLALSLPSASAGQTLLVSVADEDLAGAQLPITGISYEDSVDSTKKVLTESSFLPTNTLNTVTTADGKLTVKGWADQTQTTPSTFGVLNSYFGVTGGNNNAITGFETVSIEVDPDATVTDIVIVWPAASSDLEITGFAGDPGASLNANGLAAETGSVSYTAGTLSVDTTVFSGAQRTISFTNPSAIAGQTLILQRPAGAGQVSVDFIAYLDTLPPAAPTITTPLTDPLSVVADTQPALSVIVDPNTNPAPTYLWEYDNGGGFVAAPGDNTSPIYSFTASTATDGAYRVTVTNSEGSDTSSTTVTSTDDGDGINNQWEIDNFGDHLTYNASSDVEPDNFTNAQEIAAGTNPNVADTDGDGLNDGDEAANNALPLVVDTDVDGYSDGYEVNISSTLANDPTSQPGVADPITSIGITFDTTHGEDPNNSLTPVMFAGAPGYSQNNWNTTSALPTGTTSTSQADIVSPNAAALSDNSGASTSATFSITGMTNIFSIETNPQIPYGRLYSAYPFDAPGGGVMSINVGSIPYARYDVVVYPMGYFGANGTTAYLKENSTGQEYAQRTSIPLPDGQDPDWRLTSDPSNRSVAGTVYENLPRTTHVVFRGITGASLTLELESLLSNSGIAAIQIVEALDSDSDGMSDDYEDLVGLDKNDDGSIDSVKEGANGDFDGDGIDNIDEHDRGTNPTLKDSDNDGFDDDVEDDFGIWGSDLQTGTDPLIPDWDGDGVLDGAETNTGIFADASDTGADPFVFNFDTDQDGWRDSWEQTGGATDFLNPEDPGGPNPNGFAVAFNSSSGGSVAATEVLFLPNTYAGAPGVEMKNWNRSSEFAFNIPINGDIADFGGALVDSSGNVVGDGSTGVDVGFTAGGGAYAYRPEQRSPYGRLFNSFIYGNPSPGDPNTTVGLTGIPYSSYDVYVYFGADGNNRAGTVSNGTTTYSFSTFVVNTPGGTGAYTQTTDTGTGSPPANYAVFSGQSGGNFDVTVTVGAGQISAGIYGVQVVDTSSGADPFDTWAATNISDAGMRGQTDDADGDGVENLGEYAFFTDPDDAGSIPELTTDASGSDLSLTYDRAKGATDVTYIAEWSTNLADWFTSGITDAPTGTEDVNITEYEATIAKGVDTAKFLRIRVTKP